MARTRRQKPKPPPSRSERLDLAFPTLVRYTGLLLLLVLTGFCLAGFYVEAAPGFVPAAGMILYKTVRDAATPEDR